MSVINQMLRDIQSREGSTPLLPMQKLSSPNDHFKWIRVILPAAGIMAAFYFYLNQAKVINQPKIIASQQSLSPTNRYETTALSIKTDDIDHQVQSYTHKKGVSDTKISGIDNSRNKTDSIPVKEVYIGDAVNHANNNQVKYTAKSNIETIEAIEAIEAIESIENIESIQNGVPNQTIQQKNQLQLNKNQQNNNSHQVNYSAKAIDADKSLLDKTAETESEPLQVKQISSQTALTHRLNQIRSQLSLIPLSESIQQINALLDKNSEFHAARLLLLQQLWQAKDQQAEQRILEAVGAYPEQDMFRLTASQFYLQQNMLDRAIDVLSFERINLSPTLLQMRALIYQKQNRHQLAVNDYLQQLKLQPNRGEIYIALGIALENLARPVEAKLSYEKALIDNRLTAKQRVFIAQKLQ